MSYKFRNWLQYFGFVGFLLAFATIMFLDGYFGSFPKTPDPAKFLVVPWVIHDSTHYISVDDDKLFDWVSISCGVMFAVCLISVIIREKKNH